MTFAPQRQEDCGMLNFETAVLLTLLLLFGVDLLTGKNVIKLFDCSAILVFQLMSLYRHFKHQASILCTCLEDIPSLSKLYTGCCIREKWLD